MKSSNIQFKSEKDNLINDKSESESFSDLNSPFLSDLIDPMVSCISVDINNNEEKTISQIESENEIFPKIENIIDKDIKLRRKKKATEFINKNYKCNWIDCSKEYRSKENLNLHLKNFHLKIKPYKCRFCLLKFSHRNGKTYHERKIHINNLPYKCLSEGIIILFRL
jgi:hypothetical protein